MRIGRDDGTLDRSDGGAGSRERKASELMGGECSRGGAVCLRFPSPFFEEEGVCPPEQRRMVEESKGALDSLGPMTFPPPFRPARIVRTTVWTESLRSVVLDVEPARFVPGQFFQLGFSVGEKWIRRSYSAASAPGAPAEFFLSLVPGGELTPNLFKLGVGDELGFDEAALGFFTLGEVPECRTLWLVSTGTGLGPYISMLREENELRRFERVIVVHGARTKSEHAYSEELNALCARDPRFSYVQVTSRELNESGLSGRVTTVLASGELEGRVGEELGEQSHALICGNPQMIEEMVAALRARGLRKHRRREPGHFNFEKYW